MTPWRARENRKAGRREDLLGWAELKGSTQLASVRASVDGTHNQILPVFPPSCCFSLASYEVSR